MFAGNEKPRIRWVRGPNYGWYSVTCDAKFYGHSTETQRKIRAFRRRLNELNIKPDYKWVYR